MDDWLIANGFCASCWFQIYYVISLCFVFCFFSHFTANVDLMCGLLGQGLMWSFLVPHRISQMCMTSKQHTNRCTTTWSARTRNCIPCFPFHFPLTHNTHTYMLLVCEQCRNCSASSNTHTGKLSGFQKNCTFCLMSVQNSNTTAVLV